MAVHKLAYGTAYLPCVTAYLFIIGYYAVKIFRFLACSISFCDRRCRYAELHSNAFAVTVGVISRGAFFLRSNAFLFRIIFFGFCGRSFLNVFLLGFGRICITVCIIRCIFYSFDIFFAVNFFLHTKNKCLSR